MALAPVEDRCLQDFWRNQLASESHSTTSSVFARLITQSIGDLAKRKAAAHDEHTAKPVDYGAEMAMSYQRAQTPEEWEAKQAEERKHWKPPVLRGALASPGEVTK